MSNEKIAVVFPGQGSQMVGMLAEWSVKFPIVKQTFREASSLLGYDLWELTQKGPKEKLDLTFHAQPALLTAAYSLWQVLSQHRRVNPTYVAGHSLGEYTALVCANVLSFADAVSLVAARGQWMQEAVKQDEGAMAAILGLDNESVTEICSDALQSSDEVLSPANFNSQGQVVIAGNIAAVNRAMTLAKSKGAKLVMLLPVSVPSHCALMKPAAAKLKILLEKTEFRKPTLTFINNVDVVACDSIDMIRDSLVRQLYSPVRWVETIQYLAKEGVTSVIECGPGKILTGLNKRIDEKLSCYSFQEYYNTAN